LGYKNKKFQSGYVAILGKPNVGKSTLLNFFLKEKLSIISEKPQTTRDALSGILTLKDIQIIFIDTPGLHRPKTSLGEHMQQSAISAGRDADIVLFIIDAESGITAKDKKIFAILKNKNILKKCRWSALLINKIDTVGKKRVLGIINECSKQFSFSDYIPICAASGENCELVLTKIKKMLPAGPAYFPPEQITDRNERYFVGEIIREQALKLCREEVPHALAVEIQNFKDNPGRKTLIQATIFVEKESQKKIVIGSNACMLKKIGMASRREAERFLGRSIYLELRVKTHLNWRKDEKFLRRLGCFQPL